MEANTTPRRNRLDLMEPAEKMIQEAIWEIETIGADERLTKAEYLMSKAKDLISDFIDKKPLPPSLDLDSPEFDEFKDKVMELVLSRLLAYDGKGVFGYEKMQTVAELVLKGSQIETDIIVEKNVKLFNELRGSCQPPPEPLTAEEVLLKNINHKHLTSLAGIDSLEVRTCFVLKAMHEYASICNKANLDWGRVEREFKKWAVNHYSREDTAKEIFNWFKSHLQTTNLQSSQKEIEFPDYNACVDIAYDHGYGFDPMSSEKMPYENHVAAVWGLEKMRDLIKERIEIKK